jgi:hypothetical protein
LHQYSQRFARAKAKHLVFALLSGEQLVRVFKEGFTVRPEERQLLWHGI